MCAGMNGTTTSQAVGTATGTTSATATAAATSSSDDASVAAMAAAEAAYKALELQFIEELGLTVEDLQQAATVTATSTVTTTTTSRPVTGDKLTGNNSSNKKSVKPTSGTKRALKA
jgi:hypothetical protein